MIEHAALLADLKGQVRILEDDLRARSADVPEFDTALRDEWQKAHKAERIAATFEQWLDGEVTQAAVAWILGTVFLRFCEDNALIDLPYLSGPDDQQAVAAERQQDFFENYPDQTDRDWIVAGFDALSAASPVAAGLFDRAHNPIWRITPSHDAAKALLAFWRTRGEDADSRVVHDFEDPDWNTRFLGDLYQDLSEYAKKTYALLQTPEFVEEFILDLTLNPAIDEFGLDPEPPRARPDLPRVLRVIDPACGSGHFLLGGFARLLAKWEQQAPATDRWTLINRVLSGLHGVDKNPFAVSIARFRLLIAAMKAGDVERLADTPDFPLNIAVGDSLLHGRGAPGRQGELFGSANVHVYPNEDVADYMKSADILGVNSYHVVVGNPPYITVKDKQENENYRKAYSKVCSGKYALSVPFADRFFHLTKIAAADRRGAGYVGQITASSFMKREFGKKLIENFFAQKVDLTHVINTSGAYIPGHGTPTVILVGRNMLPTLRPVRAVLSVRGEPSQPEQPAEGRVWRAIVDQIDHPGSDSEWVTVTDLTRDYLRAHPWSLSGGGAGELLAGIESRSVARFGTRLVRIGFFGIMGADEAMTAAPASFLRDGVEDGSYSRLVIGDEVRDWRISSGDSAFFPYTASKKLVKLTVFPGQGKRLWPYRTELGGRATFTRGTYFSDGRPWYEWHQLPEDKGTHQWAITFAFVATHNHFVLDRGGKVFKQSAPVIKLPEGASEDNHLSLLAVLNSSIACFWLKEVSYPKGGDPIGDDGARVSAEAWSDRYEFTGTKLQEFPLPGELPLVTGRDLDALALRLSGAELSAGCAGRIPTRELLENAHAESVRIRAQMIALQEELDWEVYGLYGLLTEKELKELRTDPDTLPELEPGERAFEIVLARKMALDGIETQWFARHGSTPITEIPAHWPDEYRRAVQLRIDVIEKRRDIALIERPECKRRWVKESWEKKERAALRNWLLDRCEARGLWFALDDVGIEQPHPMTVNRLADRLRDDADFVSVARLYAENDAELSAVVTDIIDAEHVPYLAALRYKDTGLRKRARWEKTWDLQRQEDATGERLNIPVPPKYTSADFRKGSYWSHRGKLDVPKERFISYPRASADGDGSLLLGWAGWDHREQAHALMIIIEDRTTRDGWDAARLIPLIAGLAEVMPWVRQWHGDVDPAFGMSPADAYAGYLEDQQLRHGVTASDLSAWAPQLAGRGRRPRTTTSASANPAHVDTQTRHTTP